MTTSNYRQVAPWLHGLDEPHHVVARARVDITTSWQAVADLRTTCRDVDDHLLHELMRQSLDRLDALDRHLIAISRGLSSITW